MIRVKQNGVVVPRHNVGLLRPVRGQLFVQNKPMPSLGRSARVASFFAQGLPDPISLVDATLTRASDQRLVLTGFEQALVGGQLVDFSQTWVLTDCEGPQPTGSRGPAFPG